MHRARLFVGLAVLICGATGLALLPNFLPAQTGDDARVTTDKGKPTTGDKGKTAAVNPKAAGGNSKNGNGSPAAKLPITHVVLFTSGVGFFHREGEVDGTARIDLSFPVQDVNDLLKSLVVRDANKGKLQTVNYDSQDPLEKALKGFAVNLSDNPSFSHILDQARGEKVEVIWNPTNRPPTTITGIIVGTETKLEARAGKDHPVEVEYLNLWADGMRSLKLSEVGQVRFLNTVLNNEMGRALEVVAQSHDMQKKTVTLHFRGQGKRKVQVGYVVEHPIWKTSYRLVLNEKGKPYLQGWAMVENPSDEDWNKVNVSLVSGRPISFRMNLYQPLYVDRPLVQLPQFANLRPRLYEGDIAGGVVKKFDRKKEEKKETKELFERMPSPQPQPQPGMMPPGGTAPPADRKKSDDMGWADLGKGTGAGAQGAQLGDFFQYAVDQPVTLPRQKSALLPIVSGDLDAERVSIYNESGLSQNPMLGLKLKNTTGLHLMQGPVTVLDQGIYAGDALIPDVQPDEKRLLSYAVDLGTEVKTESKTKPAQEIEIRINKGVATRTVLLNDTKTYIVKNRSDQDRLVLLEHPNRSPDFKLLKPAKADETTRSYYHFEVKVPAGKSATVLVLEEKKVSSEIILTNANSQQLVVLLKSEASSPAVKKALEKVIDLKNKLAETQNQIRQLQSKLQVIGQDQARQRENMKVIPQNDPVYKKYLDKFLKQEGQIEKLQADVERLQAQAEQQRQAYETYVSNLTIKKEE